MSILIISVFLLCAGSGRAIWRAPLTPATLTIVNNSPTLASGGTPNITCTSHNFPYGTETLYFMQRISGSTEEHHLYNRGLSPLQYHSTVQSSDHGTSIVCRAVFSETNPGEYKLHQYLVRSDETLILLTDGTTTKAPTVTTGQVKISTDVDPTSLAVNATVRVTCEINGLSAGLTVFQSDGVYSYQLHYGWQSYREVWFTVDEKDNGTYLICEASTNDYNVYSERIYLTVK